MRKFLKPVFLVLQDESAGHDIEIDLDEVLDMEDDAVRKQFLRVRPGLGLVWPVAQSMARLGFGIDSCSG